MLDRWVDFRSDPFVGQNGVFWYIFGFYSSRVSVALVLERNYPSVRYGRKWLQIIFGTLRELCEILMMSVEYFSLKCHSKIITFHIPSWLVDNSADIPSFESVSDIKVLYIDILGSLTA